MELEKQVTNKELSQKMKELGFKQESLFYWVIVKKDKLIEEKFLVYKTYIGYIFETGGECSFNYVKEIYSAYTIAELGEIIKKVSGTKILKSYRECGGNNYDNTAEVIINIIDVNFLAKMLIYLKENKLI